MTGCDSGLLVDLERVLETMDPVPVRVVEAARAVFDLRTLDAELIDLVRDSADLTPVVAVRGQGDVRLLSFHREPLTIELQVTDRDFARDLIGQVSGVELTTGLVETLEAGVVPVELDDGGLAADEVPAGPVRLLLTTAAGQRYATDWVTI